ncbi:MAG TPA: hypothetical protein VFJ18_08690 [Pararhizobium sp.]|nr:hypothetical protein [Pararhizobium sp.]
MSVGTDGSGKTRAPRLIAAVAGALVLSSAAGCTTASLESAAPKAAAGQTTPATAATALQPATTAAGTAATQQTRTSTVPAAESRHTSISTHRRRSSRASRSGDTKAKDDAPNAGRQEARQQDDKQQSKGTATENAPFVEEGAAQSKTFPKFVPPKAAAKPMTDAEKKAFEEQMAARMKTNAPKNETPAQYAERMKLMRALAAEHGEDTLKAIQDQKQP